MGNRYDDKNLYSVRIEFPKFSKRFDNVPQPSIEDYNGAKILVVKQNETTSHHFNLNHIDYYTTISVGDR